MKAKMLQILRGGILITALTFLGTSKADAQCPMCRMGLESNLKNGGTAGKGINAGILFLLATPYLLVGGIAFVWFRNKKSQQDIIETSITDSAQLN
ncbi:MAG: hypothetical protein U5L45_11445 [Saprospiraceae bacterium]|nr:hypothetical protein [Saprospiraceae bacterium]